jgi:methylenetetrahydrofolate dehydrogenase (NADP+)/methenyltetrahydrofolate cyclohydrolase
MIIDGKQIAADIRAETAEKVKAWTDAGNRPPYLSVVLVGENPASASYVRGKARACTQVGIESDTLSLPISTTEDQLLATIDRLNNDASVDGILVQLPLPDQINETHVIERINPAKDVDGFHPVNVGRISLGQAGFPPATPAGIVELLRRSGVETSGARVVILVVPTSSENRWPACSSRRVLTQQ